MYQVGSTSDALIPFSRKCKMMAEHKIIVVSLRAGFISIVGKSFNK